jgi:threonine aldolase
MKQGGIVAAACLVAIEQAQNIPDDHRRAKELAQGIAALLKYGVQAENVVSNMVLVDVRPLGINHLTALAKLKEHGVLATRAMPDILRLVVHRDIDDEGIQQTIAAFGAMAAEYGNL